MPQKTPPPKAWTDELGQNWQQIHQKYLHTIGNLTLTGYNSELSNLSFLEKRNRDGGFRSSSLQLNTELAKLEHWNDIEIEKRSQALTELALKIWSMPQLDSSILQRYGTKEDDDVSTYSEQDHYDYGSQTTNWLYDTLKSRILAMSNEVKVIPKKRYITFLRFTNFLDVVFYKNQLNLYLNTRKGSLDDPRRMAENVSDAGHWGNGDYRIIIQDTTDMEYLLSLIKQSFDENLKSDVNLALGKVTEEHHLKKCGVSVKNIYNKLKTSILSISPNITIKANKYYIAFINRKNFIYLKTKESRLELDLNMKKGELNDPKNIAIDRSSSLHYKPCEYTVFVDDKSDLEYILTLIMQAYEKN